MHLSEHVIFAKSKASHLDQVMNLNCAGMDLVDISIAKELRNIEMLSLSANRIGSLEPIQNCSKLHSLFLRKNNISDAGQLKYLAKLPLLTTLFLSENPLCEKLGANYRATVLRKMPHLKKLDGHDVTEKELEEAVFGKFDDNPTMMDSDDGKPADWGPSIPQKQMKISSKKTCNTVKQIPELLAEWAPVTGCFGLDIPSNCKSDGEVKRRELKNRCEPSVAIQLPVAIQAPPVAIEAPPVAMQAGSKVGTHRTYDLPSVYQKHLLTAAGCIISNLDKTHLEQVIVVARDRMAKLNAE